MDPEKLKLAKNFSLQTIAFSVARAPHTSRIYFGCSDTKVYEADVAAPKFEPKVLYAHGSYATGVALAGKTLVSGSYDCKLTWYDTDAKKIIRSHDAHAKWIRKVRASRDGKVVASVADDMICKLWDAASGKLMHELRGHAERTPNGYGSMLFSCAFSADGKRLATADKLGKAIVWDVASGKKITEVDAPIMYTWDPVQRMHSIGGMRALAFSPDGKTLAVGGTGKIGNIDHLEAKARIELFDIATQKRLAEHTSDKQGLANFLEFTPDGKWLLTAGGDTEGFLAILDSGLKKAIKSEKVAMHVHDAVTSENAETLIAVGHHKVAIYEMKG